MKTPRILILTVLFLLVCAIGARAADAIFVNPDGTIPLGASNTFKPLTGALRYGPFTIDPTTWRLRVDLGTNITVTGTVTTATNQNISHIGGSAIVQTNGIQTVYDLSTKPTNMTVLVSGGAGTNVSALIVGGPGTNVTALIAGGPGTNVSALVVGGAGTNVTAQLAGGNASVTNFPALLCATTFTGPNDTTAYAANQIVNGANNVLAVPFTFTNAVLNNGGSAILDQVRIVVSNATFLPSSYLAVYCSTNVTGFSNRMAFSMFYTNASVRRFIIPLNALAVSGSGGDCASVVSPQLGYLYNAATADKNAYFHWFLGSAATPVANQPYYIEATFRQLR